jgi:hypothetical protein
MNFRRDSKWSLTVITAIKVARMMNYKNAEIQKRNKCRKNENCVIVKNSIKEQCRKWRDWGG